MALLIKTTRALALAGACTFLLTGHLGEVQAADDVVSSAPELALPDQDNWAVHGQITNITQHHAQFNSPYSGQQSLMPDPSTQETTDATLFVGRRLWDGAELWANVEADQGFGFNNTLGLAGFSSGGAYKIGANKPYYRVPKLFVRQTVNLEGTASATEGGPNQFAASTSANNIVLTAGKFSVTDMFDTNSYAHDPRADFLNWAVIDAGTYDYSADPWGYTWGAVAEWTQSWWTLRAGFFQLSPVPNGKIVRVNFGGYSADLEWESRHVWAGHPGKIKLLAWIDQGKMGSYQDAIRLAIQTGSEPSTALVRRDSARPGLIVNAEQELSADVGAFLRASANRGDKETYEFTDINQSLSGGVLIKGSSWQRTDDDVGVAVAMNRLSGQAQNYFAAGGLGLLIGDGRLNYAPEKILELFYAVQVIPNMTATLDYQHITNPAYNQDRGPVSMVGLRLHASF